jgi:hypothetical protein
MAMPRFHAPAALVSPALADAPLTSCTTDTDASLANRWQDCISVGFGHPFGHVTQLFKFRQGLVALFQSRSRMCACSKQQANTENNSISELHG